MLSERIRPDVEAAPWVIDEVKKLEQRAKSGWPMPQDFFLSALKGFVMQTSYFAKYRGEHGVNIAIKPAPGFTGPSYPDLFPKWHFLKQYKIDGDEQKYIEAYYTEVLTKLDPKKVWIDLADKTLLCWEKSGTFCHRRLVAEWLQNNLKDVSVPEAEPLGVNVQRNVSHSFTDSEVQDMALSCVPMAVQVRNILNSVGFKFEDDGKPSLIINHNPKPLGVMKCWRDEETMITHYSQIITAGQR